MSCRIDRNENGQITKVYDSNGNESALYNQLVQVPGNTPELALEQYLQTLEPEVQFVTTPINNGLTSHMFMVGDQKVGTIRTKPVEGGVKVDQALVTEGYRGQGVGTELYLETIRNLMAEGKKLFSDTSRTAPAERIWEKLVESGLAIKKEDNTYETILVEGVTPETTIDEIIKTIENGQTRITELGESGGDRTRWNPSRGSQTLEGAPVNTKRKNVTGADPELTYWAEEYARRNGIDYRRQSEYVMVDVDRAMRIAQAYEDMPHAPQDPTVKEAYENLIKQTIAQYNILVEGGYQFYFFDETNDPYDGNPLAAMEELRNEKRMGSFATEAGFGTGNEGLDVSDNPMLADTGLTWGWGSVDGPQKRVLANDLFRCFTPETLVRTSEGFKEIQDIKVGDLVLTHEGRFKKVYDTIKNPHKGKILNISTNASYNPIRVTPEHPFYVLKGTHGGQKNSMCTPYICDRKQPNGNVTPQEKYHSFEWVEAKDLKEKMWFPLTVDTQINDINFIEIPNKYYKGTTKIPQKIELTEDFLSFVGLYIAEGSGGTNRINISLHKDEKYLIDLVDRFAKSIGYSVKSRVLGNGITLQINCKILKDWFSDWLGRGSNNKKIPNELLQLPPEKLKHIAYGIFSGDGKKKKNSIEQTSLTLALQLMEVGARLGLQPTANSINYSKNDKHSDTYTTHEFLKAEHNFKQKKYTWRILEKDCRNITKIEEEYYEGFVYNIEVEDDHSYVVENVPVHNCVHDAFGHGLEGAGFRARGEENAWQAHARLFTGSAVGAITSETRGQNSWLNFGKYGEQNRTAKVEDTVFAPQKTGLMPEWTWKEGFNEGNTPAVIGAESAANKNGQFSSENPNIYFKVGETTVDTYKDALKVAQGQDVQIGVLKNGEFVALETRSSNINPSTREGWINNAIVEGIVKDVQYVENGVPYLEVEGYSVEKQLVNDPIVEEFAYENNMKAEMRPDGTFQLTSMSVEEDFPGKELNEVIFSNVTSETQTVNTFVDSDSQLVEKITSFLEKLGFSLTTIEDYKKRFLAKNGSLPNAEALVDLANQVVAFKDGRITEDALTEEFAHIMLEALPQEELANMLSEVHNTPEWAEFYQTYMDIYNNESMVRKEILGKILARGLQNKTQSTNIFQRIWSAVTNFINSRIKGGFDAEVSNLTDRVHDMLIQENISSLEDLTKKKFRMYRVDNTLPHLVKRAFEQIQSAERHLSTAGSNKYIFNDAMKKIEAGETELAVVNLLDYARRATRYVQEAMESSNINGRAMSSEELIIATQLKTVVADVISKSRREFANNPVFKEHMEIAKEVSDAISLIDTSASQSVRDSIIDRVFESDPLIEEKVKPLLRENQTAREYFEQAFIEAEKDTNFIHSLVGSIAHARDVLLNLLNRTIKDMVDRSEKRFFDKAKDIVSKMKAAGLNPEDFSKLMDEGGYAISFYDWNKYDNEVWKAEEEVLRSVGVLAAGEVFDRSKNYRTQMTDQQALEYGEEITKRKDALKIPKYTQEYYDKLRKRYEGLDPRVVSKLEQLDSDRNDIMRDVKRDSEGRPVFTKKDKLALEAYNIERKKIKSFYSDSGELRKGINLHSEEQPGSVKVGNLYYTLDPSASEDAVVAFGINEFETKFFSNPKNTGNRQFGIQDQLILLTGMSASEAKDFIQANINFGVEFENREEPKIKDGKEGQYNAYKILNARRANLLNKYRDPKNGANILYHQMNSNTLRTIRDLTDELSELRRDLFVDNTFGDDVEFAENEAYRGALRDLGIAGDVDAELDFALQHVPSGKKSRANSIISILDQIAKGKAITDFDRNTVIKEFSSDPNGIDLDLLKTDPDYLAESKLTVAKKRMAPYFKATVPVGVTGLMERLYSSVDTREIISILDQLDKTDGLRLSMHYSYYEGSTIEYNPEYNQNFIGANVQPVFKNSKFETVLGLTPGTYTLNELGVPVMNPGQQTPKMVKAYEIYINAMQDNLVKQGADGMGNVFLAPQVSKTGINKISSVIKNPGSVGAMVKEVVEEVKRFRVDELEIGEVDADGESLMKQGIKVIPRRFINKLERVEDVSDDLFYSMMLMSKESEIHKSRKEALPQIMALEESAKNRKYNGTSKEATSTNTYKMLRSTIDYNLFGVSEVANYRVNLPIVGTVDLAKLSRFLHKYVRDRNLAYQLIVPITSLFTAEVGLLIEKYVGEYVDPSSYKRAFNELNKLSPDAFKEGMQITRKSKIAVLAERNGMFDLVAGYENSKFNPFLRLLGKAGYIFHTAANYSPIMKSMLGVMMGHRLYDGRFMDLNDYTRKRRIEDSSITSKTIQAEWSALANKSFYDYVEVEDGTYKKDYAKFQTDTGLSAEDAVKMFDNIEVDITLKVQKVSEAIDGNIRNDERTQMQRHFLLTFLFTHKGWMSIALARRFKSGHYNTSTKKFEEGHYITASRALQAQVRNLVNIKDLTKFKEGALDAWAELSPEQQRNVRRVGVDMAVVTLLYAIVLGMTGFADDDENKDNSTIQLLTHLMERTLNETRSTQLGLGSEILNTIQEPVVGFKELRKIADVSKLFDLEEVKRGRYQGLSGSTAYLLSAIPGGKSFHTLSSGENINYQRRAYNLYNSPDEMQPLGWLIDTKDVNEAFGN